MFRPNATRNVQLEPRMTPSGVSMPVNSEGNRNALAAAYAADGDPTMTAVMCGFWLQAAVLDVSTKTFTDVNGFAPPTIHFWDGVALRHGCSYAHEVRGPEGLQTHR